MFRFNFLITLLFVAGLLTPLQAQWVCEYTASKMESQKVILTCGVGESEKLSKARVKARKNAMEEFQSLCSFSTQCQDYDFSIEPLRIDCKKLENENYRCYRALRIRISDKKKSDTSIDYKQSQTELKEKQKKIDSLKKQIKTLKTLYYFEKAKKRKQELLKEMKKRLLNVEAKKIELQEKINRKELKKGLYTYVDYVHPKNSINFNMDLKALELIKKSNSLSNTSKDLSGLFLLLELSYERTLWKHVSIEFSVFSAIGGGTDGNGNSRPYRDNTYDRSRYDRRDRYDPYDPYDISPHYYETPPTPSYEPKRYDPPSYDPPSYDPPSYETPSILNKKETSHNSKLSISNIKGSGFATRSRFYLPPYSNLYFSLSYEFLHATIKIKETKEGSEYLLGTIISTTSTPIKREEIQVESSFLGIGFGFTSPRTTSETILFKLELGYSWPISTNIDLKNLTERSSYSIYGGPYFLLSMGMPFSFP